MQVVDKTKEDLANEVAQLRQRIAELEKSEVVLEKEAILNTLVEHVIHEDREMKILWANKSACDSVGLSRKELIGRHCYEIWPKRSDPCPDCPVMKAMETGQHHEVEKMTPDGRVWFIRGYPLQDEKDNIVGGIEFTLEITERKQAEKELQESEVRFRALFEGAPDAIFLADPESGEILDANPAASHLLLRPHEEIVGLHQSQLHPPHMEEYVKEGFSEHLQQSRRKKQIRPIESVIVRSDGTAVPVEVLAQIVRIHGKDVIQGIFRDITERKRAEEALEESEKRFRNIFETIPVSIIVLDKDGQMVDINPYHLTQIAKGQTPKGDFIGKNIVTHPTIVKSGLSETYEKVFEGESFDRKDVYFPLLTTGDSGYFNVRGVPLLKDDEVIGAVVIHEDITERKKAQEELRQSEVRYRFLFENSQTINILIGMDGKILDVNESAAESLGYKKKSIIGKAVLEFVVPDQRESVAQQLALELKGEYTPPLEIDIITKKGARTLLFTEGHATLFERGELTGILLSAVDITERKQTEAALRESEERFRRVVETMKVGLGAIDENGVYTYVNEYLAKILGYSMDELIGRSALNFVCDEEGRKAQAEIFAKRRAGMRDSTPYEVTRRRKDGRKVYAILSPTPNFDADGRYTGSFAIHTDITERKRMEHELRESEEKYRSLVESSEDSIYLVDSDCNYIFLNKKHLSRLGMKSNDVIGKNYHEFHSPEESKDFPQRIETVLKTGNPLSYEYRSQRDKRYFIRTLSPVKFPEGGKTSAITVISKDITDLKQVEETLREREAFNFALFQYNPAETIVVDLKGRITRYNLAKKNSGDRLPTIGDLMYKDYAGKHEIDMRAELIKCIRLGKIKAFPRRKYGDKYLSITIAPFSQGALIISEDITERKRAEEALRESVKFSSSLLNDSPHPIIVINPDTSIRYVNPAMITLTGFSAEELIGRKVPYPWWPKGTEWITTGSLKEAIRKGNQRLEKIFQKKNGERFWVEINSIPAILDGEVQYLLANWSVITERKQAEELLQKERDTFYSILQKAPYGVMLIDKDGNHSFVNTEFTNITGYKLEDVPTTKDWLRQAYPDPHYRNMVSKIWRQDLAQQEADEKFREKFKRVFSRAFNVVCNDGITKEIEFTRAEIGDGGIIAMLADITERKSMHELLETAAAEWRTTFDAISDSVCLLDQKGKIVRCNNAMLQLIEKPFSEISNHYCWEVMHGDLEAPPGCPITRVAMTNQRETEVFAKNSRWFNVSVDPLLDENGAFVGGVHIMSDITDRKVIEDELQSSREQLRNLTVYLESVREQERTNIAREIHDELAQTLTALKMDLSWLNHRLPRDQKSLLEKTQAMNDLVNTTIQTVKRISAELRPGILDDLGLVAAIEWQAEEFQNRTGIVCHVTVDPHDIMVDQDRSTAIFRIFQETLTNVARHAQASKVTVSFKKKADTLILRVKDNGRGITEDQISAPQSFGLIGMQERIHPWGGKVSFKGIPGKGTTVMVNVRIGEDKK
jgi:PAS domain S-box-containing protein